MRAHRRGSPSWQQCEYQNGLSSSACVPEVVLTQMPERTLTAKQNCVPVHSELHQDDDALLHTFAGCVRHSGEISLPRASACRVAPRLRCAPTCFCLLYGTKMTLSSMCFRATSVPPMFELKLRVPVSAVDM
ncbi:hypothetical protein NDU88_002702 [Pleurodeles waltl]|uniref:Uncharacterized protein n=1 Tax=Pleurodeles waltl TaxID=8319 RepID=A0AAV7M388_PLEWA|nr:hypothetical protein NDU88_002702 [Pleurodeles waltl]